MVSFQDKLAYDNYEYEELGVVNFSEEKSTIYVKFVRPVTAYRITLYDFRGAGSDTSIKISEIKVYTSAK